MNWIETKKGLPEKETEVLCSLRDVTKKISDRIFIGGVNEIGKWYIYCSDGEVEPEDNRYYISHWCELVYPEI